MLFQAHHLVKEFSVQHGMFRKRSRVRALDGISFAVRPGASLGIAGESGSGKTTVARILLRLIAPDSGTCTYDTREITNFRKDVQMIFQNPYLSLNPRMRVEEMLAEPLLVHGIVGRSRVHERCVSLVEQVGLDRDCLRRYPDEFSGGQRQRIAIARALTTEPRCIVLDEPVSSLDLTVQQQMLALFRALQKKFGLTFVFISHNLAILRHICDDLLVMRAGRIVEQGALPQLLAHPQQPYTKELLAAAGASIRP